MASERPAARSGRAPAVPERGSPWKALTLLVLTSRKDETVGVDLESGSFIRAWDRRSQWNEGNERDTSGPARLDDAAIEPDSRLPDGKDTPRDSLPHRSVAGPFLPFSFIRVTPAGDPTTMGPHGAQDPALPEVVEMAEPPTLLPIRAKRRQVRRLLEPLITARHHPLLGFAGSTARYWTLQGSHPSVALVALRSVPSIYWHPRTGQPTIRFAWQDAQDFLPFGDPRGASLLEASPTPRLTGEALVRLLGYAPIYALVTLSPPRDGICVKEVAALLPEPRRRHFPKARTPPR